MTNLTAAALVASCLTWTGCGGAPPAEPTSAATPAPAPLSAVVAEPAPLPLVEEFGAAETVKRQYCVRKILTVDFGTEYKVGDIICLDCFTPCGAAGTVWGYRKRLGPGGPILQQGTWKYVDSMCVDCPAGGYSGLVRY
jgi:hypothetical protein